jgi:hypothetical protein
MGEVLTPDQQSAHPACRGKRETIAAVKSELAALARRPE